MESKPDTETTAQSSSASPTCSPSSTPETDARIMTMAPHHKWELVGARFARKLERERNEARALARELFDLQCWAQLAGDGNATLPDNLPSWLSENSLLGDSGGL